MHQIFADYMDEMQLLWNAVYNAITDLPVEGLDWKPGPEMNSIGVLVVHLIGAGRWMICDMVGGKPLDRDRDAEFVSHNLDEAMLKAQLAGALDEMRAVLEKLTPGVLTEERFSSRHNRSLSVAWILDHTLEHTALHIGHIEVTRHFWDMRQKNS